MGTAHGKGLAIYRGAYRTRLVDALGETFPKTLAWVGEDSFGRAAAHHLITNPPSGWTLDEAGKGFPDTLVQLFANDPEVAELAWLEWSMHTAFVAKDCTPLDGSGFAAATVGFSDSDWADLRLSFAPGLATAATRTSCITIWKALAEDAERPDQIELAEPMAVLVWREALSPVFRSLSTQEAACLERMRAGMSFGGMCEWLTEKLQSDAAIAEAGAMLGRWIEDGLVVTISTRKSGCKRMCESGSLAAAPTFIAPRPKPYHPSPVCSSNGRVSAGGDL